MQTAVLERTRVSDFDTGTVQRSRTEYRRVEIATVKLRGFITLGLIGLVLMSAVVGALNAYATGLEISASRMDIEIKRLDENMQETQRSLDSGYNNIILGSSDAQSGESGDRYFVKETWEVGG